MALYIVQPGAATEAKPAPNLPHLGIEQQNVVQSNIGNVFYTNQSGAAADYQKYLYGATTKVDHVSEPTTLSFSLVPYDSSFVKLQRGAYIVLFTNTYGYWYSGYITNEPQLTFLGTTKIAGVSTPIWGYQYQAVSDEYLLNLNPVGIQPPFINTTQGAILKSLITSLCPGGFNLANIQAGQPVARYVVDPKARFSDIVKDFADQSAYRFWSRMKSINFVPYDFNASPITIDGNDKHFTPVNLSISMVDEQVVNDVVVLGDIEPQTYFTEFFVGDGITGSYPLSSSTYGVDSTILLQDDFSSSTIDTSKWTLFNTANNYLQVANGYVNLLGGDGTGVYGTYLQSANLIPLEGHLRLTHGEWDFVSASSGVIAGLWTLPPNSAFTGCVYGLSVTKSGANTIISPVVNGVVDATQSITIDYTKRYVIRTLFFATNCHRFNHGWGFLKQDGTTGKTNGVTLSDTVSCNTVITAIDPLTGQLSPSITFTNATTLSTSQTSAWYIPAADDDLHCTFTMVTISSPLQAKLSTRVNGTYTYVPALVGPNELDTLDGLAPIATIVDANNGVTTRSSLLGSVQYNSGAAILQYFKNSVNLTATLPQKGDLVSLTYRSPGAAIAHVQNLPLIKSEATAWGDNGIRTATVSGTTPLPRNTIEAEQLGSAVLQDAGYQHFEGSYKQWSGFSFTSEPMAGMIVKFANLPSPPFFSGLQSELITQVSSTFNSLVSGERFEHSFSFGKIDRTKQVLAKLTRTDTQFVPQDTVELPFYIDYRQVGTTFVPNITNPPSLFQFLNGNVLQNNDFENGSQNWATTLIAGGTSVLFTTNDVINAHSGGSYVSLLTSGSGSGDMVMITATVDTAGTTPIFYPVTPGDVITFGGWIWSTTTGAGAGQYQVNTYNSSKTLVANVLGSTPVPIIGLSTWQFLSNTFTVAAGVAYITFNCIVKNAAGSVNARFDGAFLNNPSRMYIGINQILPVGSNLLLNTTAFNLAPWTFANASVTATNISDPIGGSTAVAITYTVIGPSAFASQLYTPPVGVFVASKPYVWSCWLKAASGSPTLNLLLEDQSFAVIANQTFTLSTTWQRFSVTGTAFSTSTGLRVFAYNPNQTAIVYHLWGAQLEPGIVPTAYNPNGASVLPIGGFQTRYTDDSWGIDPARNLLITGTDTVIAVPRTSRGKSVFTRQFDTRNILLWPEDLTNAAWLKANGSPIPSVVNNTQRNPDNDISTISTVTFAAGGGPEVFQVTSVAASSATATFTVSVKGTAGQKVVIRIEAEATPFTGFSSTVTFNGAWQRVSVSGTWVLNTNGPITAIIANTGDSLAKSFQVTRASVELAAAETIYCKTLGTTFGAMSRFSSGVRVNHPLIPQAPTASVTYLLPSSPVVTVGLPASLSDVWGTEIRASNNATVLYHKDLVDANYLPQFTDTTTLNRNLNYFIYTYNLLGEYSPATNFTLAIPNSASGNVGTGKNGLYNPGFEIDEIVTPYFISTGGVVNNTASAIGTYVADAWFIWDNSGINGAAMNAFVGRNTGLSKSGASCALLRLPSGLTMANGTQQRLILTSECIPATPGKYYYVAGNVRTDGTIGTGALRGRLSVFFSDTTGTFLSQALTADVTTITNAYVFNDVKVIAPVGAAFVQASIEFYYNNSSGSSLTTPLLDVRFDDLYLAQSTDPSFPDVLTTGSIPPTLSGGFTYTGTTTSLTWSWSSLVMLRADGTSVNIGTGSQAITGLTANTPYFFYPYYDELAAQLVWLLATGGVGSPAIAYTAKTQTLANLQTLQSRVPLSIGALTASTDTGGGGGVTGGGGGSGPCVRSTTLVNKRGVGTIAISECSVGDYILGKRNKWTRIVNKRTAKHKTWIRITLPNGEWLDCTPTHGFTLPLSNKRAYELTLNDIMYVAERPDGGAELISTIKRIEIIDEEGELVMITCKYDDSEDVEGHLFYAGATSPTILTHNGTIAC